MESLMWKKLKETGGEYARNTDTPGYKYLTGKPAFERYFWYLIHASTLLATYFIGRYVWDNFMTNPTMINIIFFRTYPANAVPLPGISVCNINKISRLRAEAYAGELSKKSGKSTETIMEGLKLLAMLDSYTLPLEKDAPFQFQNFLDKYDADDDGYYNTHDKLGMLQVPCSELLDDCVLYKKRRRCSDIFVSDLTMEGHCCIFNYHSERVKEMSTVLLENGKKPISAGNPRNGGLKFKLNYNVSDYMITSLATEGVKVLVSLPKDFPDTTSGGLLETLVGVGVEVYLHLSSIVTFTINEVKKYPIEKRGCIFPDETDTIFGSYSYSDCIMDCKIKSIGDLCRCIPFNYIHVVRNKTFPQCTLADLKCLNAYAAKWRTMYPLGLEKEPTLAREKQHAIRCPHCVPACSDILYRLTSDSSEIFQKGEVVDNFSIVHVVFDPQSVTANEQDVFFYWFDMIGLFGGLCSVIMGVSFVSLVEILYFFTYVFACKIFKELKVTKNNNGSGL